MVAPVHDWKAEGRRYLSEHRPAEATYALRRAVERTPDDGEAYALLGEAEAMNGLPEAAQKAYREAAAHGYRFSGEQAAVVTSPAGQATPDNGQEEQSRR